MNRNKIASKGFSVMKSHGVIKGNRKKMPGEALSSGKSESTRAGLNSKSIALGRSMGVRKGRMIAKDISKGASDAVRFAQGGHLGIEPSEGNRRYELVSERAKKLEAPHYKSGGRAKSLREMQRELCGPSEKQAQMRKLGVKRKDVYDGEPHNYRKKGGSMHEELWIQAAIKPSKKGSLHKALGVPMDRKIPSSKLEKAEHSRNPLTRKRANLAATLRKFNHRGQR